MKIESAPIESLFVDPANVRKHGERNLKAIKASLSRWGQQKPIVVDGKGRVVAGNGTLDAAVALGWSEIDVVRTDLVGAEAVAYAIADNRTAELAEWDLPDLAETLAALQKDAGVDELATGYTADEIAGLIAEASGLNSGDVVEDEVPAVPVKAVTKPGDLWVLGEHRVLCGDSTKGEEWDRICEGADLLLTDPPYGELRIFDKNGKVGGDHVAQSKAYGAYANEGAFELGAFLEGFGERAKHRIIWGGNYFRLPIRTSWLCWDKRAGDASWFSDFELAWTDLPITAQLYRHVWQGMIREGSDTERFHPTQKPVALFAWCIGLLKGCVSIADGFLGSGTTLIAAEQLGRKCYGIEIEPRYVDVVCKRWMKLTGKSPVRESDGAEFGEPVEEVPCGT